MYYISTNNRSLTRIDIFLTRIINFYFSYLVYITGGETGSVTKDPKWKKKKFNGQPKSTQLIRYAQSTKHTHIAYQQSGLIITNPLPHEII